jgi:hypothetical protein
MGCWSSSATGCGNPSPEGADLDAFRDNASDIVPVVARARLLDPVGRSWWTIARCRAQDLPQTVISDVVAHPMERRSYGSRSSAAGHRTRLIGAAV